MATLYAVVVVQCGISPDYFLDRMQWYEVEACLKGLELSERTGWEQTRYICYLVAQVNSSRQIKPSDVLKFEWDGKADGKSDGEEKPISAEEFERMKRKAAEMEAKLSSNKKWKVESGKRKVNNLLIHNS